MNACPRGRAIAARARRVLSWGALAALWTLQASGVMEISGSNMSRAEVSASPSVVRADIWDDILKELFGTPDEPAPEPDPVPPPPADPPPDEETW